MLSKDKIQRQLNRQDTKNKEIRIRTAKNAKAPRKTREEGFAAAAEGCAAAMVAAKKAVGGQPDAGF